jgi:hypothetical protein
MKSRFEHRQRTHTSLLNFLRVRQIIPLPTCSFRSCQTFLPEHEHTVFSLSHTPALLAMTPTKVSASSRSNGPSLLLDTTILRPITSHIAIGLSKKVLPLPSLPTVTDPRYPLRGLESPTLPVRASHIPPVEPAPREISPLSRTVASYVPGDNPRIVRSISVRVGETCTIRARPRTGSGTEVACVSRMHTPALFEFPLPLRIASRPVASMAEAMADGAAVPSMKTNWSCKFASTLVIPKACQPEIVDCMFQDPNTPLSLVKAPETSLTHESQCSGTANVVCQSSNDVVTQVAVVD